MKIGNSFEFNEEVFQFLTGYFHQDIESVEFSIEEFVTENSKSVIERTIISVKEFLIDKEITNGTKNSFIESQTSLYFPAFHLSPLDWLTKTIYKVERLALERGKIRNKEKN